jgi:dTDP-glucose pyrophosphorylase/histidinol phosphatase-like enzyme
MSEPIRQALILAGGRSTRLGAITEAIPKPMLRIAGDKPFIDYLIEMIERHGYEDILLLGGYLGEVLEAAYDGRRIGRATIRVLLEKAPLGTAGALTVARETLDSRFLLMNGDAFFDINLRALEQASLDGGAMATLALRSVGDAARYGRVIEEQGKVAAFLEKDPSRPGPGIINGGIYVLKREILDLVSAVPCSLEQDVFPALVERGQIRGKAFDGYFLDIGLPETLEQGHRELPNVRVRPAALFDRRALMGGGEGDSGALQWTAGAVEAVRALNDRGYYVFVMSGASDGGRLNAAMQASLAAAGAHVDRFTGAAGFASGAEPGSARGPAGTPGAFAKAMDEWPIVREKSFFVGVASEGIEATRAAAITGEIFDGGDLARFVEGLLARPAQG